MTKNSYFYAFRAHSLLFLVILLKPLWNDSILKQKDLFHIHWILRKLNCDSYFVTLTVIMEFPFQIKPKQIDTVE